MFSRTNLKHAFTIVGSVLAVASMVYFIKAVHNASSKISIASLDVTVITTTAIISLFYAATLTFLALGWCRLLLQVHGSKLAKAPLVAVYAIAQFAKYVPGNIFHFAGRHALLNRRGFGHRALLLSTFQENLAQLASAILIGFTFLFAFPPPSVAGALMEAGFSEHMLSVAIRFPLTLIWTAGGTVLAAVILKFIFKTDFAATLLLDGVFYIFQAILFILLLLAVSGEFVPSALGLVTLSWIAGFITPGAPGGIGVREVILLFALGGLASEADIVLSIALYRIATFAGDAIFFAGGSITKLTSRRQDV